jgi:hypothetical protein
MTAPLTLLKGDQARGYYFRATDRAPGPGEYKYLYQGKSGLNRLRSDPRAAALNHFPYFCVRHKAAFQWNRGEQQLHAVLLG